MGRTLDVIYAAGALVAAPVWATGMLRTGKWRTDWKARFGRGERVAGDGPRVLVHAVSVGEVNATRALIDLLTAQRPDVRIIVASTTNTGFARAAQLYGDTLDVVRYPFDFTGSVKRFLDRTRPDVVALMELEVWPNFVQQCDRRSIPVCVVNGRLTERSYHRYQRLGPLIYRAFRQLAAAGVQTDAYAERFAGLGVPRHRIRVLDTMKWDTAQVADTIDGADELARDLGIDRTKPLIVAGSTGPGEEKLLLDAKLPGVQLLLVPRKPERFDEVAALDPRMIRRTKPETRNPKPETFLLDTMGELRKAYALADVVIVGRTFSPTEKMGGSDPIEPVALGKAAVIGTDHFNFAEVVTALSCGGGISISRDPMASALELLDKPEERRALADAARAVITEHRGATQRYVELVLRLLDAKRA